jgi:hypothetical protein
MDHGRQDWAEKTGVMAYAKVATAHLLFDSTPLLNQRPPAISRQTTTTTTHLHHLTRWKIRGELPSLDVVSDAYGRNIGRAAGIGRASSFFLDRRPCFGTY